MRISSLSFVLPMYNEKDNIEKMVAGTLSVGRLVADEIEVVVVDDASTDGSGRIADRLAALHPEVRVVHHKVNRKLGGALKTGFYAASMEYVLYMDSDLPVKMEDIPPALARLGGADMLIGFRISRAEGVKRAVMSWVYNRMIRALFGLKVTDVNFAFKLFRRSLLECITLESEGSFIDAELLIEARRVGARIVEQGFTYYPRVAGVSTLSGMGVVIKIFGEMSRYMSREKTRCRLSDYTFDVLPAMEVEPELAREVELTR
jgi:glycosyltransferase involved in cell wall biosynthesis